MRNNAGVKQAGNDACSGDADSPAVYEHELDAMRAALERAENARRLAVHRCEQFYASFEEQLAGYRKQRAWQIMLWIRKAYTLLRKQGLRGKLDLLGCLLKLPWETADKLRAYDLDFPSLPAYLPPEIVEPFLPEPARVHWRNHPECLPPPSGYDVLVLAIIDFEFRFQRPQQISAQFARNGHRVFWISPAHFLPPDSHEPYRLSELRRNLWEVRLRAPQPDIYQGSLGQETLAGMLSSLSQFHRDYALVETCLILQLPFWRKIGLGMRESYGSKLLYDCMDDWENFPGMGPFNISEQQQLAVECDVLSVSSESLAAKFARRGARPILVRNAADFDFFEARSEQSPQPDALPRPVVGYFGAVADWFDADLVHEAACVRPQYSFVLIGQVFRSDLGRLTALGNVHLLGAKPYQELPRYLTGFDICMVPFQVNALTDCMDPVKLYEYFSQGKPVVATRMAESGHFGDLVYQASDPADFVRKLDAALQEPAELKQRRIDFARSNTWADRVARMDDAIRAVFDRISILIVTHNSAEYVRPCLESVLRHTTYPNWEAIIVDNDSRDGTREALSAFAGHVRMRFFSNSTNAGFAAANNLAARHATGECLLLLNIDTIVTAGWLESLTRHYWQDRDIGVLVPMTNFAGNEIKLNVGYRNLDEMEEFSRNLAYAHSGQWADIEVAPLFCALTPRRVWNALGGLDESFTFGMFEDDDFSRRVRRAGYRVAAAQDCFVHHFGHGSFRKLPPEQYQKIFNHNRALFERKWETSWKPHRTRPGVLPSQEEPRFEPESFCRRSPVIRDPS